MCSYWTQEGKISYISLLEETHQACKILVGSRDHHENFAPKVVILYTLCTIIFGIKVGVAES
jgi:hypothetical protein